MTSAGAMIVDIAGEVANTHTPSNGVRSDILSMRGPRAQRRLNLRRRVSYDLLKLIDSPRA